MKDIITMRRRLLAILFATFFFFVFTSVSQAQSVDLEPPLAASISADILPDGSSYLQVVNPDVSDTFFYHKKIYSVKWYQNGTHVGEGPILIGVQCGDIAVIVEDIRNKFGTSSSADLGVCNTVNSIK